MATTTSGRGTAMSAHQRAVKALIAEYPERYDELRRAPRVVSPAPGGKSPDKIREQIAKARQEKIDALNAELANLMNAAALAKVEYITESETAAAGHLAEGQPAAADRKEV